MSEFWSGMSGTESMDSSMIDSDRTGIFVNGSFVDVGSGGNFVESVKAVANDAGLGKFRVLLNGSEIQPSEAPESFDMGTKVELRPYEVAG